VPGIVGLITDNPDQEAAKRQVSRMVQTMLHHPSYARGTYSVPELGCYLGWVAHAGAYSDCNPVVDDRGDVALIFSGEHFTHDGGGSAHSAPRCLLKQYLDAGAAFVEKINGWFSGVIVDRRSRSVVLFNDRYGVNRVYYHQSKATFTFASEAKSVLSVRPDARSLDPVGLGQFLGFGTAFGERTLFSNVSQLPAASCWSFDRAAEVRKQQYFHPKTWADQPLLEPEAFYKALHGTVARILPTYFRASSPVGLSLTGGLDTRIVMAGMPKDAGPMKSYTYGGAYRDCFDVGVAREVATACGKPHQVIPLGKDFFDGFGSLGEETVWLTDGCLDLCGAHEIYFSRSAREFSPIRLTGNYGSEVLRSVSTFKYNAPSEQLFDRSAMSSTAEAGRAFAEIRSQHPVTFAAFKEIPWNLFGRLAAAQTALTLRSPYMDNELVALMYQAPPRTRETNETSRRLIADLNPALAAIGTDMGYGGTTPEPLATIRRLHRYAIFKAEWYYNMGMPQWLAPLDGTFPLTMWEPLFLGWHKIDHYRLWFRGPFKTYLTGMLTDDRSRSRPYLNRSGYDDVVRAHVKGGRNSLNEVNKVVTLELIHRLLIERDYAQ
jgi:asparagine synthase (glutamine-hydrolysing)